MDKFNYQEALNRINDGKFVAREHWKNSYIWLLPKASIKSEWCKDVHLKSLCDKNGGEILALGSIRMLTEDNKILTGWVPSQDDMFANDWTELLMPNLFGHNS